MLHRQRIDGRLACVGVHEGALLPSTGGDRATEVDTGVVGGVSDTVIIC